MDKFYVIKKSGEREEYDEEKVRRSMNRVGVPDNIKSEVLSHIKEKFENNQMTTDDIFRHILEFLEPRDRKSSLRFNLRQAIFDLGPTGFPFEQYLAQIFKTMDYKVSTNNIMNGDCVRHEIDLLIEKEGHREIVEVKFHNHHVVKTDVQVALYTYARFLDVKEKNDIDNVWLVTNTKLTSDAISYANCKGMPVIAWNYPEKGNLQDLVEDPQMYPITLLSSLSESEKKRLIEKNVVFCRDLFTKSDAELADPLIRNQSLQKAREDALLVCPLPSPKRSE
ncbi:MAG: restriction endonuclease [Candidatus Levybacteria bacterium]|nr:restriction endonuclease [Candidatus Levybacteria bacterium]